MVNVNSARRNQHQGLLSVLCQWTTACSCIAFLGAPEVAFAVENQGAVSRSPLQTETTGGQTGNWQVAVNGDPIIWDNGVQAPGAASSQLDTVYPFDSQVADDFLLCDQDPCGSSDFIVTGIEWVGTYWNGYPGNPLQGFNILFYADAGCKPTGSGPTDPSGTALINQFIPYDDTNETPTGGSNEFSYSVKLVIPFLANCDTTYWVGIQAVMQFPPQWGWNQSTEQFGCESQQGFPLIGVDYWASLASDRAFRLRGIPAGTIPTGACCKPDDECEVLTECECDLLGGIHQGNGTVCADDPCPNCDFSAAFGIEGGQFDNFSDLPENSWPRYDVSQFVMNGSGFRALGFDEIPQQGDIPAGTWFGHTFGSLPQGIEQAILEVRVRASSVGDPSDDTIGLQLRGNDLLWSHRIGDLPEAGGSWQNGDVATLALDLATLPLTNGESLDLRPELVDGFLDVTVEHNSGVDAVHLEIATCRTETEFSVVHASNGNHEQAKSDLQSIGIEIIDDAPFFDRFDIRASLQQLKDVESFPWVVHIEELPLTSFPLIWDARRAIKVEDIQGPPPNFFLDGSGVKLGIIDNGAVQHCDFDGRLTVVGSPGPGDHATLVAGVMAGNGANSSLWNEPPYTLRGMAPGAELFSWVWGFAATKMQTGVDSYGVVSFNNSWTNYLCSGSPYRVACADFDRLVHGLDLNIFWPAGNYRNTCANSFNSLVGEAAAKNIVVVGGLTGDGTQLWPASSWGPTDDGRLRPDVVAVAEDIWGVTVPDDDCVDEYAYGVAWGGTSFASPAAAGAAALLIDRHRQLYNFSEMPPALLRGILCNTATDLFLPGPDYQSGWGTIDAMCAQMTIDREQFAVSTIENGQHTWTLNVPFGVDELKVTVAWSDPPAVPLANPALVNDLDVFILGPFGFHWPYVMDPTNPNLPGEPNSQGNHLDNLEGFRIQNPIPGNYSVIVNGNGVVDGPQEYTLTWSTCDDNDDVALLGTPNVRCSVQWDAPLCESNNFVTVPVTIYNDSNSYATFYIDASRIAEYSDQPGTGCNVDGPTKITVLGANPIGIGAEQSQEVTLEIERPVQLDAAHEVACYDVRVTNMSTGRSSTCHGSIQDRRDLCAGIGQWNYEIGAGLEATVNIDVLNTSGQPIDYVYRFVAYPVDMLPKNSLVSLDGLPPATSVTGALQLEVDESTVLSVSAAFTEFEPENVHDLVLETDGDGDGVYEAVVSVGLIVVRNILDAESCLVHGKTELCLDLNNTNGIEPRSGGPTKLVFQMTGGLDAGTIVPENVQIECAVQSPPAIASVTLNPADTITVELVAPMADLDCCRFSFDGVLTESGAGVEGSYAVISLQGDLNFSGGVSGGDASIIKPHFGEIVGVDLVEPQWDFDRNGGVTGGDFALIKPLLGHVADECP